MIRPRLAIVSDYSWPTGGVEEFVAEFLDQAAGTYNCRLISWSESVKRPAHFDALRVIECGDVRILWEELEAAAVILVCTSFNVRLLARATADFLASSQARCVVVVQTSAHSDPTSGARKSQEQWLVSLARNSARIVAVSSDVATSLAELDGFPADRVTVIENGSRLLPGVARSRGRTAVSFIGRPHRQKGFHLFERLVGDFRDRGLRFSANTVSVPPASMIPGVEYSHLLTDRQLAKFFEAADLLIAPYLRADGLPLALLEALNCGVPVLGFDVPGVGQLLRRHGQLAVEPNYERLRDCLESWRLGEINPVPPTPGCVPSWRNQVVQYLRVLEDVVQAK
jgi:glycosyltransferase involved in cell wall biosynthesis